MKKHRILFCVIAACIACALVFGMAACVQQEERPIDKMDLLQQALAVVQDQYIGTMNIDELDRVAAEAVIDSLDNYSYMTDTLYTQSSSSNIGIQLKISTYNEFFVDWVWNGFPADHVFEDGFHLQRGDELYGVTNSTILDDEGNPVYYRLRGLNSSAYSSYVTGPAGTVLTFTIYRGGEYKGEYAFTKGENYIPRALYVSDVYGDDSKVGYIRITSFSNTETVGDDGQTVLHKAADDFVTCIEQFKTDGMTKLVLDLRGNGGGDTKQLAVIASYFVPLDENERTCIVQMEYTKTGQVVPLYVEEDNYIPDLPVVILCNSGTASAAEGLIGACRAYHPDTTVVGTPTYGKGVFQRTGITLHDASSVSDFTGVMRDYYVVLVCGNYYIVDPNHEGGRYHISSTSPLTPDIEVKADDTFGPLAQDKEMVTAKIVLLGQEKE